MIDIVVVGGESGVDLLAGCLGYCVSLVNTTAVKPLKL